MGAAQNHLRNVEETQRRLCMGYNIAVTILIHQLGNYNVITLFDCPCWPR